ncbi:MAG: exodeoxyribonuclease VII small subunit [Deltaproteobacteria bacterium]|nr:exodeoxyribonuclease VII small subunit [Deltaproteobacteria bacterium]
MKKEKTFSEILKELEDTVERMNRGEISIDKLGETVKDAVKKVKLLKKRLRETEMEIDEVFKELEGPLSDKSE